MYPDLGTASSGPNYIVVRVTRTVGADDFFSFDNYNQLLQLIAPEPTLLHTDLICLTMDAGN